MHVAARLCAARCTPCGGLYWAASEACLDLHPTALCTTQARPRSTLFTGSQRVAEQLTADLKGKARPAPPASFRRTEVKCN